MRRFVPGRRLAGTGFPRFRPCVVRQDRAGGTSSKKVHA